MTNLKVWNCILVSLVFLLLGLLAQSNEQRIRLQQTLDTLPFHPQLCENTGFVHNWFLIGKKGVIVNRADFVLNCDDVYGYNKEFSLTVVLDMIL